MTVARFVQTLTCRRWLCGGGVAGMLFLLSALVLPTNAAEKINVGEAAEAAASADASGELSAKAASGKNEKFLAAPETDVVVARIDALLREGWKAHNVRPSRAASDGEWCRRVYLDLLGRTPTVAELDAYLARRSKTKRAELVNRLLGPEYAEEFARNWTTVWTNVLIGRTGGTDRQSITSRSGMKAYLSECFAENRPYNQMVRELITASGDARPEMPEFNGAVNFLVEKLDEGGVQAAAKSAQIFLGMSVQCTQCHNHPFNEHRQNQFWELNAFFRQARVEVERPDDDDPRRLATLSDADIAGEGKMLGRDNRSGIYLEMKDGKLVDRDQGELYSAPLFYELRNGQLQVAYPAFVDGRSLAEMFAEQGPEFGNSGRLAQVNRRAELAKLMLAAPELERAAVNRLWAHFMGYGFTKPIDDMGSHNPASHPELLEELANDFRASGFDMKQLMRWIALSEAYGLSSEIGAGNKEDDPEQGRPPQFSRFYVRQMGPEQLYESLLTATHADAGLKKGERERLKEQWLEQFNTASGNDEGTETTSFNGSIPQALTMMNGELVRRACSADSGGFLATVANDAELSDREKINYLYRAALGRLPGKDETNVCNELLAARYGNVVETLQDVWWAVLNSNEFILNH